MTVRATVLIPTHNHGSTLLHSLSTALSQTVEDLEVFVVGDGVPDITREIMTEFMKRDERVRFFDNPKGPRHGEIHRHVALAEARGEIVCYLCDDDLWFPEHVETLRQLLEEANFAHTLPFAVLPGGTIEPLACDLSRAAYRTLLMSGINRIPLSHAGHSLELYRKLAHGWRTTPLGIPTDLYMYQQFLAHGECSPVSGFSPTVLHLPSPMRLDIELGQRVKELEEFGKKMRNPAWRDRLVLELIESFARELTDTDLEREGLRESEARFHETTAWRLQQRALRLPIAGPLVRAVARALVGRSTR